MSDADDDDAPQTVDELRAKLDEYARSLADVEASLADAPGDEELIDLKDSLEDVIEITRDVLATTLAARDDGANDDAARRRRRERRARVDGGDGDDDDDAGRDVRGTGRARARRRGRVAKGTVRASDGRRHAGRVPDGELTRESR